MSVTVRVRYYNVLRDAAGCAEESFAVAEGATLLALLRDVIAPAHPAVGDLLFLRTGEISPYARFFWNETAVRVGDFDRPLQDGDEIRIFPAVAGG